MPVVAWLGLALIVALAVPAWRMRRRARDSSPDADTGVPSPQRRGRAAEPSLAGAGEASKADTIAASARIGAKSADGEPAISGESPAAETLSAVEIFRRLQELAFGVQRLGLPALEAYDAVAPDILSALESVATEPRYAPRRPLLLPQLLRAMRDDEVSRTELARIIARDPALTGSLLKLANGAFYRISDKPVESIDRAVALLGTEGIRSLVATALVQPVFRLSEREFPSFPETVWDHTLRAATAAESHAAIIEDTDPFAAQLLGLIMGLGSIVVFRVSLDRYAALADRQRRAAGPSAAVMASILNSQVAAVASRIAGSWELSGRMIAALADQMPTTELREPTSLGRSLYFGRLLGALAVLRSAGRLTDETAKASMLAIGATEFQFDRIWTRLIGRGGAETTGRREGR